jgi:ferritin-like metal-binding protein YciE
MATIDSLSTVLVNELRDLYDAVKRLTVAIPKLSRKASSPELRTALNHHLRETQGQVRRLEKAFRALDQTPRGKPCAGMRGIIEEGNEHTSEDFERDDLRDVMIIGSAMRVEHYEMAAHMGAIAHARMLGRDTVVDLLEATLAEEAAADKKLRALGEAAIDMDAPADNQPDAQGSGLAGLFRTLTGNGAVKSNRRRAKKTARRRTTRAKKR